MLFIWARYLCACMCTPAEMRYILWLAWAIAIPPLTNEMSKTVYLNIVVWLMLLFEANEPCCFMCVQHFYFFYFIIAVGTAMVVVLLFVNYHFHSETQASNHLNEAGFDVSWQWFLCK